MVPVRLEGRRRERLLVVGGGMAALKLVEELVEQCPGRYEIVVAPRNSMRPTTGAAVEPAGGERSHRVELRPAVVRREGVLLRSGGKLRTAARAQEASSHGHGSARR